MGKWDRVSTGYDGNAKHSGLWEEGAEPHATIIQLTAKAQKKGGRFGPPSFEIDWIAK